MSAYYVLLVDPIRRTTEVVVTDEMKNVLDVRYDTTAATRPWVRSYMGTQAVQHETPGYGPGRVVYEPKRNIIQRKLVEIEMAWPKTKWGKLHARVKHIRKVWKLDASR